MREREIAETQPGQGWIGLAGTKEANKPPDMVVNRHKYFRWTRRTAFLATMYVVVVPATLGYFGYITDVSTTWVCGERW